jgi:hypothetical protein
MERQSPTYDRFDYCDRCKIRVFGSNSTQTKYNGKWSLFCDKCYKIIKNQKEEF